MRTVTVSTFLDAPADVVWTAARTPAAFRHVTRGVVDLPGLRDRSEPWREGESIASPMRLLGLPFSTHHMTVARVDAAARTALTHEHGGLLRVWRHAITVTPDGDRCRYEDRIEVDAGRLTGVVAAFATGFYRLRQRRWRRLAPVLAAVAPLLAGAPD